jgi:hypothetical protein
VPCSQDYSPRSRGERGEDRTELATDEHRWTPINTADELKCEVIRIRAHLIHLIRNFDFVFIGVHRCLSVAKMDLPDAASPNRAGRS